MRGERKGAQGLTRWKIYTHKIKYRDFKINR